MAEPQLAQVKRCSKCGATKPLENFHKARRATGVRTPRGGLGVAARCKACASEARKPGLQKERDEAEAVAASGNKRCGSCREIKPLTAFHVRRASNDGRAYKCVDCVKQACLEWRTCNPGAFQRWAAENADHRAEYGRRWREENADYNTQRFADWARANPHKVNALRTKRRAAKLRATPPWADAKAIEEFYVKAAYLTATTGIRHEVDHIYPLQGRLVCGLHCETNLQILTKTENIRKHNRMPEADA